MPEFKPELTKEEIERLGISFEGYVQIKKELGNEIMNSLYPMFEEFQKSHLEIKKSLNKISTQVEPLVRGYKIYETTVGFASWLGKHFYKLIIIMGAIAASIIAIRDARFWESLRHIFKQ